MLCEHLGQVVDVDPVAAAYENAVVYSLRKHGPSRQKDVWIRTRGKRIGPEAFQRVIDSLVERRVIVRETTNHRNSFILRMAPDERERRRAERKVQSALTGE